MNEDEKHLLWNENRMNADEKHLLFPHPLSNSKYLSGADQGRLCRIHFRTESNA